MFSTKGNAPPFAPFMGGPAIPAFSPYASPSLPGTRFKLNPRAPPYIPGALAHPPTPISPTKSDASSASTVLPATATSEWRQFAPRVPVTGPYGADILGHSGSTVPVFTQAGHIIAGPRRAAHVEPYHGAASAQYSAIYYQMGGCPWNNQHPYGWAQPVFASAPDHLAYSSGGWNDGYSGTRKNKKKGKKSKGKGKGAA